MKKNEQMIIHDGEVFFITMDGYEVSGGKIDQNMFIPVKCNLCSQVYDLCNTKIIHRYSDCTVYTTPCCNQNVDDREYGWTNSPAFTRLDKK